MANVKSATGRAVKESSMPTECIFRALPLVVRMSFLQVPQSMIPVRSPQKPALSRHTTTPHPRMFVPSHATSGSGTKRLSRRSARRSMTWCRSSNTSSAKRTPTDIL